MEYRIVRSKRKTLSLQVGREGKVTVRAPLRVSNAEIERFVMRHAEWVARKQALRAPRLQLGDGASVEIAGKALTVTCGKRAAISDSRLVLPQEGREAALIKLLREISRERMEELLDRYCTLYGFSYTRIRIGSARRRWGSCNGKGQICFSFRSAFLPDPLAEYLAVHELCHTREMNHSARFWEQVASVLPDYKTRRAALKRFLWATDCL